MDPKEKELMLLWQDVNFLADAQDENGIRELIATTHVVANMHVGEDKEAFDNIKIAEWVLGQWLYYIDSGSTYLATVRNISCDIFQKVYGDPLDVQLRIDGIIE